MRSFHTLSLVAGLCTVTAQPVRFVRAVERPAAGTVRGATRLDPSRLLSWGQGLSEWRLPGADRRDLAKGSFGRGGCVTDVDADGRPDLVVQDGIGLGRLTWRKGPDFTAPADIDTGVEFRDCQEATLFDRRGILVVHRYLQMRFYEIPRDALRPWPYREIYSFYTASNQGGLLLADIDGDGRQDILCGNYWIRSPATFELPWRLFAINAYHETPAAATARLALIPELVWAEAETSPARLTVFTKPSNPQELWAANVLKKDLHYPQGLAAADFDGDGRVDFAVAENNGSLSRLIWFHSRGDSRFDEYLVDTGVPVHTLIPSKGALAAFTPTDLVVYRLK